MMRFTFAILLMLTACTLSNSDMNAQKFTQADNLKQTMQQAGVLGKPEIYFMEDAADTHS